MDKMNSSIITNNNSISDNDKLYNNMNNKDMNKEKTNFENINEIEDNLNNKKEENEKNYYEFFGEIKKKNIIFDDGIMYFSDDSEFLDMNNISLKIKEYCYIKNFESPCFLYNKYFFS